MRLMGFGSKWVKWIHSTAPNSVLVNGSPTKEFNLEKGVRQGDPLSPFPFIFANEGLSLLVKNAASEGLFEDISVGTENIPITHLPKILGLQINISKSCLYGVGISGTELKRVAEKIRCKDGNLPFDYLGLTDFGGLDIVSLNAKNVTLICKWWWRFLNENDALWIKIVKNIYVRDRGLGIISNNRCNFRGSFEKMIGTGTDTKFWTENWIGSQCFKDIFQRLYMLEMEQNCNVCDRVQRDETGLRITWNWVRNPSGRTMDELAVMVEQITRHAKFSSG
ncbi:uncharacterized protein [Rutidosis leptorrhynchoides]|uniref:uncharacterized protein n=1 Tax=Rutidosis leptorrhynchoides TaxID=125765 RepID=UPI003A9A5F80